MTRKELSYKKINEAFLKQKSELGFKKTLVNKKDLINQIKKAKKVRNLVLIEYSHCCEGPYKNCWIDYSSALVDDFKRFKKSLVELINKSFIKEKKIEILFYETDNEKNFTWTNIDVSGKLHTRTDYELIIKR